MSRRRIPRPSVVLGAWLAACFLPLLAQAEPLAVIVHPNNPTPPLTKAQVAQMYRGEELHWAHDGRIKLVNREISSPSRKEFYRRVLNAKPDRKFYRPGTPIAIQSLIQRSDEAVIRFVSSIESAIGYVRLSKVKDTVRVVLILEDSPSD